MSTPSSALSLSSSSPLFIHTITITGTGTRTRHTLFNCRFIFFNKPLSYSNRNGVSVQVRAVQDKSKESSSPEDITKKYGLEAGLWKVIFITFSCYYQGICKVISISLFHVHFF